jgi:hypothetical protein
VTEALHECVSGAEQRCHGSRDSQWGRSIWPHPPKPNGGDQGIQREMSIDWSRLSGDRLGHARGTIGDRFRQAPGSDSPTIRGGDGALESGVREKDLLEQALDRRGVLPGPHIRGGDGQQGNRQSGTRGNRLSARECATWM